MELVYLWVKKYKNIHEQGFNFSPKFTCKYDEKTNKLTIDKNDDYIENFFGDNINVTAIVGKNGSGKSSVLEIIKSLLDNNMEYSNNFILFHHVNEYFYHSSKEILKTKTVEWKGASSNEVNIITHSSNMLDTYLVMNQLNTLYDFDNDMSCKTYKGSIPSDDFYWNTFKLDLMTYRSLSQNLILKYILNKKIKIFNPDKFALHQKNKYFIRKISAIVSYYSKEEFEKIKNNINKILLSSSHKLKTRLYIFLQQIIRNDENSERTKIIYDNYRRGIIPNFEILDRYLIKEEEIIKLIDNNLISDDQYSIEENKNILMKILNNKYTKYIFTDLYPIVLWESNSMRQFKDLSTGEIDLLLVLSLLFDRIKENNLNFILLDEIESFFHPSWSKNVVKFLINELHQENIHLILTTHSPFLLSDIPKQNIIFLDTYENGKCKVLKHDEVMAKKQTFGANIHTLLSDSFFMEDGLMGEFAKGKINDIYNFIVHHETGKIKTKEDAQAIIDIIGEPLIQRELQQLFDKKFELSNMTIDDEISVLERKIQALKEIKNDTN